MKLNQLAYITQLLERHKIPASQLVVIGKNSNRISFTLPKSYHNTLTKMCDRYNLKWSTSLDIFLPKTKSRYHITLKTRNLNL